MAEANDLILVLFSLSVGIVLVVLALCLCDCFVKTWKFLRHREKN